MCLPCFSARRPAELQRVGGEHAETLPGQREELAAAPRRRGVSAGSPRAPPHRGRRPVPPGAGPGGRGAGLPLHPQRPAVGRAGPGPRPPVPGRGQAGGAGEDQRRRQGRAPAGGDGDPRPGDGEPTPGGRGAETPGPLVLLQVDLALGGPPALRLLFEWLHFNHG